MLINYSRDSVQDWSSRLYLKPEAGTMFYKLAQLDRLTHLL